MKAKLLRQIRRQYTFSYKKIDAVQIYAVHNYYHRLVAIAGSSRELAIKMLSLLFGRWRAAGYVFWRLLAGRYNQ